MELSKKQLAVGILALFIGGAAVGRFSLPAKVETKIEEKIVVKEVIKWKTQYVKNEQKDKETVIIETHYPDGKIVKETHIVDKGTIVVNKTAEGSKETDKKEETTTEKTVEYANRDWSFAALAAPKKSSEGGVSLTSGVDYGLHVQRRVLGPFYLGGFGLTDKTFGASLGVIW